MGMGLFFGGNENVLKRIVVMATQLCDHTKNHRIVHFKWVNCMVYELHLKKVVILKKIKKD